MLSNQSAGAAGAKARAMHRNRLTAELYAVLAAKPSLAELAAALKAEPAYAADFRPARDAEPDRRQLAFLLRAHAFEVYERLRRYVPDDAFYDYPARAAELRLLLSALGRVSAPAGSVFPHSPRLPARRLLVDAEAAERAAAYADVRRAARGTLYADALARCEPPDGRQADFAACEYALRAAYYAWLFAAADRLAGSAREGVRGLFARQVELVNLANIYRMKRFYAMPPARVASLVFPYYGRIPEKAMQALAASADADAFSALLAQSAYGARFAAVENDFIEQVTHRIRAEDSLHAFRRRHEPAVVYAAYLSLLDTEAENLVMLTEGVHAGLEAADMTRLLIL